MLTPFVLVPLHLDALPVSQGRRVASPTANFTRLPHFDGARDINPDIAWLSEEIVTQPFSDETYFLGKGVHLHWKMPAALTRATHTTENSTAATFPALPNRWLITRGSEINNQNIIQQQWVLESDYVYSLKEIAEGKGKNSIVYPTWQKPDLDAPVVLPYRRIGRVTRLEEWSENVQHLDQPLTAVGYGEPSFAAFYPNCHSVFGFHDDEISLAAHNALDGIYYQVIGFYSNPKYDFINTHLKNKPSGQTYTQFFADKLRWAIKADQNKPSNNLDENHLDPAKQHLVCHGSVTNLKTETDDQPPATATQITIGHSITEALSNYLANQIANKQYPNSAQEAEKLQFQQNLEDQLEAILLSAQLDDKTLDIDAKFQEARHNKGFTATEAGISWTLKAPAASPLGITTSNENQAAELAQWPDGQKALEELNRLQHAYNQAQATVTSLQRQLYSDWYKYMLTKYPPENEEADYVASELYRFYIAEQTLPELERAIARTGQLHKSTDSKKLYEATPNNKDYSLAKKIENSLTEFLTLLATAEPDEKKRYQLKEVSGPRFWRPTEPAILLTGKYIDRADTDDRIKNKEGLTTCRHIPSLDIDNLTQLSQAIPYKTSPGANQSHGLPWHPFLLQWDVELRPITGCSNLASHDDNYDPRFITRNYVLKKDECDLRQKAALPFVAEGAHRYQGSSLLTPHATDIYIERLEHYLNSDTRQAGLEKIKDPLKRALDELKKPNFICLAQVLSGFNDALLMHKQTLQLPVDDPIGFRDAREFATRMRNAIGREITCAPQPFNDFCPLRNGELHLHRLRLIGTFGRIKDIHIDETNIQATRAMNEWEIAKGNYITLPPRLVQPARVQFRWLRAQQNAEEAKAQQNTQETKAQQNTQETNAHPASSPICGWVQLNKIDFSLHFYTAKGAALGHLSIEDGNSRVRWRDAPRLKMTEQSKRATLNPDLEKLKTFLLNSSPEYFGVFLEDLYQAQALIEPEKLSDNILMSQPLALTRASLKLELQSLPAQHQGWNEFRKILTGAKADTDNFEHIRFPIRLGEQNQLNDGLAVYFLEDKSGGYQDNAYVIPNYDPSASGTDQQCDFLYQSIASPALTVAMLMDPRALVHVTTGIVPVKSIHIPPHHYTDALNAIEMDIVMAPLLTQRQQGQTGHEVSLGLNDTPQTTWGWLEKNGTQWSAVPITPKGLTAPTGAATEIIEGWLTLAHKPSTINHQE